MSAPSQTTEVPGLVSVHCSQIHLKDCALEICIRKQLIFTLFSTKIYVRILDSAAD